MAKNSIPEMRERRSISSIYGNLANSIIGKGKSKRKRTPDFSRMIGTIIDTLEQGKVLVAYLWYGKVITRIEG